MSLTLYLIHGLIGEIFLYIWGENICNKGIVLLVITSVFSCYILMLLVDGMMSYIRKNLNLFVASNDVSKLKA